VDGGNMKVWTEGRVMVTALECPRQPYPYVVWFFHEPVRVPFMTVFGLSQSLR
jgi:hypothetical protein